MTKRLRLLSEILARELELVEIGSRIQSQVQSEMDKGQREYFLRQQLRAIQEELGEVDEQEAEAQELRTLLEEANLPEHVWKVAERELGRFERLPPQSAEHGVIRTYLEWLASLPWSKSTEDNLDLKHARKVLDRDHYDIERVKDRILEFLAVRKLKPDARSSIVCFVGPPGVGKTSLGRSIAAAHGAQLRAHLGGRRARRVGDPRPPPHLHRRDARNDHPRAARRRLEQPGADDRRDRQDGNGLPRRPGERDAGGARPRAELELPRPLPRCPVRPLERLLHLHREPGRHDSAGLARPHGGDRALRLHARGEARDRHALPRPSPDGAERRREVQDRVHQARAQR